MVQSNVSVFAIPFIREFHITFLVNKNKIECPHCNLLPASAKIAHVALNEGFIILAGSPIPVATLDEFRKVGIFDKEFGGNSQALRICTCIYSSALDVFILVFNFTVNCCENLGWFCFLYVF